MESRFQGYQLSLVVFAAMMVLWTTTATAAEKVVVLQPDSDTATEAEVNELATALRGDWEKRDAYSVLPTPEASVLDLVFDAECGYGRGVLHHHREEPRGRPGGLRYPRGWRSQRSGHRCEQGR